MKKKQIEIINGCIKQAKMKDFIILKEAESHIDRAE
jgi:hypothetical protein